MCFDPERRKESYFLQHDLSLHDTLLLAFDDQLRKKQMLKMHDEVQLLLVGVLLAEL
jgi:hypothetical protein